MKGEWLPEEDELLTDLTKNEGLKVGGIYESGKLPNRSYDAISRRLSILKLTTPHKKWSNKRIWRVWILYKQGFSTREVGAKMGETKDRISNIMTQYGITMHPPSGVPIPESLEHVIDEILGEDSK